MKKLLRVGVLGCAAVAKRMVLPAMRRSSSLRLVAVASREFEKAKSFAAEFGCEAVEGYAELLRRGDIDVVYVPLPTGLHAEWVAKALEAGKHVLVEKSMGMTLSDAEQMVARARVKRLLLKENYMFQYHQQQEVVRRLIIEEAGTVRVFRANFGFPPLGPSNFRYDRSLGGGALLDCGGYVLKAIEVFFPGSRVCVLAASLTGNASGVDIAGSAMLKVVNGSAEFPVHLAFGFDHRYQCNIEVWGSRAKVMTDRTFTAGLGVTPNATIDRSSGVVSIELPPDDHFLGILNETVKIIESGSFDAEYEALLRQASLQEAVRSVAVCIE